MNPVKLQVVNTSKSLCNLEDVLIKSGDFPGCYWRWYSRVWEIFVQILRAILEQKVICLLLALVGRVRSQVLDDTAYGLEIYQNIPLVFAVSCKSLRISLKSHYITLWSYVSRRFFELFGSMALTNRWRSQIRTRLTYLSPYIVVLRLSENFPQPLRNKSFLNYNFVDNWSATWHYLLFITEW